MLRPNFARTQIGDLEMFESRVQHLIHAIRCDGKMVYSQDVFFKLTLDTATEFLFGKSVKAGESNKDVNGIVHSFVDSLVEKAMANRERLPERKGTQQSPHLYLRTLQSDD